MALIQTFSSRAPAPLFSSPHRRRTSSSSLRLSSSSPFFPSFPYHLSPSPSPTPKPPFQRTPHPDDQHSDDEQDIAIGDCLVFEDGAFEHPLGAVAAGTNSRGKKKKKKVGVEEPKPENLVPEKWKEAVEEINLTKKEKRKIAYELRFGCRVERRKAVPLPDIEHYRAYREKKLEQLKPVARDEPNKYHKYPIGKVELMIPPEPGSRAAPKNPRVEIGRGTLDDISEFFNSREYAPVVDKDGDEKPADRRKIFTDEERHLMNRRKPDLSFAFSRKWLPLHILAASGEFHLLDRLMKHAVDINAVDQDGLTALHRAIICKKHAIVNYLLRNSANPFVRDNDGATLMHYAVHAASSETIKILLLYNVDINISDHDGWTPLHLAVQAQRTDIVKLLLIKGADQSIKNNDGLTPLQIGLYSGHHVRMYELIKLLKTFRCSR